MPRSIDKQPGTGTIDDAKLITRVRKKPKYGHSENIPYIKIVQ